MSGNGSTPNQNPTGNPQGMPPNMMMGGMPSMGAPAPQGYNPYQPFFPSMPGMMPSHGGYPPGFGSPLPPPHRPPSIPGMMPDPPAANDKEKPEVHVITLHPRGMPRPFDVPFPERRLPVCDRCQKNYKSRDLCRTRDGHKTLPWTTTYVAVTIDESLIVQDEQGKASYADLPAIGLLMDTPLMCLGPADGSMKAEPICKVCREKNYTRDYCRNTCKHTTPPWSTTYVKIVADTRNAEERMAGYGGGKGRPTKRRKKAAPGENEEDGKVKSDSSVGDAENLSAYDASYEGEERDVLNSDDLGVIHQSRTFLAAVSSKSVIIRWCERIQYPEGAEQTTLESAFKVTKEEEDTSDTPGGGGGGPNVSSSTSAFGGANSASTPSQQQLWDAFRAGAMWAQSQAGQMPPGGMPPGGYGGYSMPMPGGMGFFSQPPHPQGPGGEMSAGPWGGQAMFGGYGGQMNGAGIPSHQPTAPGSGGPQDWNKKSFRNKNPADENGVDGGEGGGLVEM
ncbi:hypothetical protein HJC23_013386 [Cyclotella cryptica]|uniref:Uncharacterized protein n=1 Tax=Cyclotella cryptica TaxID=29204 RepID=A0ABD3PWG3_9STRA|eukprot:CCRYP_010959-RA/>CCRYP_010959-RA protein AED:0.08 eAED:0.08 QI:177/1/1/1/0.33/0/4/342/505